MNASTPVSNLMTRTLQTVGPNDSMEVVHNLFSTNGFHHLPVLEGDALVGMVSFADYLKVVRNLFDNPNDQEDNQKYLKAILAKDVMSTGLVTMNRDDSLENAIELFRRNRFHAIPILDETGQLVGILTTYDMLDALAAMLIPERLYAE